MITYEQAVKLAYLGFRLMIIYKLISVLLYLPTIIPTIIREMRDEEAMAKKINNGTEPIRSNYKSTTIGFITTEPIIDEKESS